MLVEVPKNSKIAFLPGGEIATALAIKARGNGYKPILWFHSKESYKYFLGNNESNKLKGHDLTGIEGTHCMREALDGASTVCFATRSWNFRETVEKAKEEDIAQNSLLLTVTKGFIDFDGEYLTPSQAIQRIIPDSRDRIVVLSGPNFGGQIATGKITGTTIAAYNQEAACEVSKVFHNGVFRVDAYKGNPVDMEVTASYKNVAGLIMGFARTLREYDENTGALVLQKGLTEASQLCEAMGGDPKAIMELFGIGDYGLLMNSITSRNVQAGEEFGRGEKTLNQLKDSDVTIEGIRTVKAIREIARRYKVSMPLNTRCYRVLYTGMNPEYAVKGLLSS